MAKIRQVGKLNIITCNKENDLNGDNKNKIIVRSYTLLNYYGK